MKRGARKAKKAKKAQKVKAPEIATGRQNYSKSQEMVEAFENYNLNGKSIRRTSLEYGVSFESLRRRINGEVDIDSDTGRVQGLTREEEIGLVNFAIDMGEKGMGLTRDDMRGLVLYLVKGRNHSFKETGPSKKWFIRFQNRHPELKFTKPEQLEKSRAAMSNQEVIKGYLTVVKTVIEKHQVMPKNIWNFDETSLVQKNSVKVYSGKLKKQAVALTSHMDTTASMLIAINAIGEKMPPLYIFKGKKSSTGLLDGAPKDSFCIMQENGWMDTSVFETFFLNKLVPYLELHRGWRRVGEKFEKEPIVITCDRHTSRFNVKVIKEALDRGIHILLSPPSTTHLLQPLDRTVFGPFKLNYYLQLQKYNAHNPLLKITKYDLAKLTREPFENIQRATIISGFESCGIYPPNVNAIDPKHFAPSTSFNSSSNSNENQNQNQNENEKKKGKEKRRSINERNVDLQKEVKKLKADLIKSNLENYSLKRQLENLQESQKAKKQRKHLDINHMLTQDEMLEYCQKKEDEKKEKKQKVAENKIKKAEKKKTREEEKVKKAENKKRRSEETKKKKEDKKNQKSDSTQDDSIQDDSTQDDSLSQFIFAMQTINDEYFDLTNSTNEKNLLQGYNWFENSCHIDSLLECLFFCFISLDFPFQKSLTLSAFENFLRQSNSPIDCLFEILAARFNSIDHLNRFRDLFRDIIDSRFSKNRRSAMTGEKATIDHWLEIFQADPKCKYYFGVQKTKVSYCFFPAFGGGDIENVITMKLHQMNQDGDLALSNILIFNLPIYAKRVNEFVLELNDERYKIKYIAAIFYKHADEHFTCKIFHNKNWFYYDDMLYPKAKLFKNGGDDREEIFSFFTCERL